MPFLREKSGAWSPEKIAAFVAALLPALWIGGRALTGDLGARPVTEAIHFIGDWAVRFLWITLAISPARRVFMAPRLINARRTLGVTAATYALCHFTLYIVDQKFNIAKVVSEIVLRFYLTIGFIALTGLVALAITSTDAMIRRLGQRWNVLHRGAYVIAVIAVIHFMLQSKSDVAEPMMMAGFLLWLFGYRVAQRMSGDVTLVRRLGLSIAAAVLTAAIETTWYATMTGIDPWRVFMANWDFSYTIRPAWWVLFAGLAVTAVTWLWSLRPINGPQRGRARPRPARA